MIHELRTYTLMPGKQGEYLKLNEQVGRKIRATSTESSRARGRVSSASSTSSSICGTIPASTSGTGCAASCPRTMSGPRAMSHRSAR